jgi:hypothetical protein
VGLVATFYCLKFETSRFIAFYDSQVYGGGILPRLNTGASQKQKRKLAAANQPACSHLASGPAGTHGHIFVQCQDLGFVLFFLSLTLLIDKGGVVFYQVKVKVKVTLRLTVGQSVSLGVESHLRLMTRYLLLFDSYSLVFVGRPL